MLLLAVRMQGDAAAFGILELRDEAVFPRPHFRQKGFALVRHDLGQGTFDVIDGEIHHGAVV